MEHTAEQSLLPRGEIAAKQDAGAAVLHPAWMAFILLHALVGYLFFNYPLLSTLHALLTLAVGVVVTLFYPARSELPIYVMAYLVGAEVLWRMTGAGVIHEFSKYVIVVLAAVGFLRNYQRGSVNGLAIFYLLYLLPHTLVWIGEDFQLSKRYISLNLSGPLSLALCSLYFFKRKLNSEIIKNIASLIIGPALGTAVVSALALFTAGSLVNFGNNSINIAALDSGANQVSNLLALGGVLCWLLIMDEGLQNIKKVFFILVLAVLMIQAVLTFSRGGVFTFVLVVGLTIPFLFTSQRLRFPVVVLVIIVAVVFTNVVFPWIMEYTGGMAAVRYTNLDTTGRWDLALSELMVWRDHPFLGVGIGKAREEVTRYLMDRPFLAHVEYTRLLAEHGILGVIALLILIWGGIKNFLKNHSKMERLWVVALLSFAFIYMGQSAMRTAAPGFLYGLSWAYLFPEESARTEGEEPHA